ncbi:MAG: acetyl-CoA carboxylase biotin carboxyl carrier protein [Crocinitomicaceae bacterium]
MDIKEIQNLIKFVSKSGVNEVALEQGDFKITIKTEVAGSDPVYIQQTVPANMPPAVAAPAPVASAPEAPATAAAKTDGGASADDSKYITIKSPMIGTFYRRPSPDKDLFVNVGDSIAEGDVICIIEAMKLFNEIESEMSGKIVKILVDDMSPVEYDQPLFLVDPS